MTDADDLDKLRVYAEAIDATVEHKKALERERDALIVDMLGEDPEYGAITAVARAVKRSRQQIDTIRRLARERRGGRNDPKS